MKSERQSNIELLRIISMLGVIVLHYNNPSIGGGIAYANGINKTVLYWLESLFVCSVDLFVLINGYFSCKNNKRTLIKPLELLIQVIVFKEAIYFIKVIFGKDTLSAVKIIGNLIPSNWFVILYVSLYLISPMLNLMIKVMAEKRVLKKAVAIVLLIFSVYPTVVDVLQELLNRELYGLSSIGMYGSQWGYSIVNFSIMYMIGSCIRYTQIEKKKAGSYLLSILLITCVLEIWAFVNDAIGFGTERSAWEYCNPAVILLSVEIFLLFSSLNIGSLRLINQIARGTFTVFLLHNCRNRSM